MNFKHLIPTPFLRALFIHTLILFGVYLLFYFGANWLATDIKTGEILITPRNLIREVVSILMIFVFIPMAVLWCWVFRKAF